MRTLQLAIARAQMAKAPNELSVLVEFRDARIAEFRRVPFGDENIAVRGECDSGRTVEHIVARTAFTLFAERQQKLSIRRKLEHLIADAAPGTAVNGPDVSLRVRFDRVWEGKHARAEGLDHLT